MEGLGVRCGGLAVGIIFFALFGDGFIYIIAIDII
jgi:hypothetical protein